MSKENRQGEVHERAMERDASLREGDRMYNLQPGIW